jgi:hypothetical protein
VVSTGKHTDTLRSVNGALRFSHRRLALDVKPK